MSYYTDIYRNYSLNIYKTAVLSPCGLGLWAQLTGRAQRAWLIGHGMVLGISACMTVHG
jgi:hypothetical protein